MRQNLRRTNIHIVGSRNVIFQTRIERAAIGITYDNIGNNGIARVHQRRNRIDSAIRKRRALQLIDDIHPDRHRARITAHAVNNHLSLAHFVAVLV